MKQFTQWTAWLVITWVAFHPGISRADGAKFLSINCYCGDKDTAKHRWRDFWSLFQKHGYDVLPGKKPTQLNLDSDGLKAYGIEPPADVSQCANRSKRICRKVCRREGLGNQKGADCADVYRNGEVEVLRIWDSALGHLEPTNITNMSEISDWVLSPYLTYDLRDELQAAWFQPTFACDAPVADRTAWIASLSTTEVVASAAIATVAVIVFRIVSALATNAVRLACPALLVPIDQYDDLINPEISCLDDMDDVSSDDSSLCRRTEKETFVCLFNDEEGKAHLIEVDVENSRFREIEING